MRCGDGGGASVFRCSDVFLIHAADMQLCTRFSFTATFNFQGWRCGVCLITIYYATYIYLSEVHGRCHKNIYIYNTKQLDKIYYIYCILGSTTIFLRKSRLWSRYMVHPPQYVGAVSNDIVAGDQNRDEARADPHGRGQVQLWQDCQESHQVGLGYSHTV